MNSYAVCLCLSSLSMYIYIYIVFYFICTHVHTPHEFSRPKHPDKNSSNSVTKFIHPKTWITLITRIPRCPVQSFFSGCIKFLEFFVQVMTWSMKKMWRPITFAKKKINPKMIGTLHFNSFIKKPTTWQIFFFQASPNRNHHIPSHQPHPINGVMPSCVFCHASGMTIMITSTSYPIYISCFKTAFLPQFYNGVPPKWSPKNVMCSFLTHFWSPKKNSDNFPLEARTGLQAEESIVASRAPEKVPLGPLEKPHGSGGFLCVRMAGWS